MKTIHFDKDYRVTVETSVLIKDYQMLKQVLRFLASGDITEARDSVQIVLECLEDTISASQIPEGGF